MKDITRTLLKIDCSKFATKKQGFTYLSWTDAWKKILENYPEATYEVVKQESGLPYVYDEATGYMVFTKVTIEGLTHEMWLPVLDGANKAMKAQSYTYKTKYADKTVPAASMFDINKTIMRCLVKNLAIFGLGLHIYAGEDLPSIEEPQTEDVTSKDKKPKIKTLEINTLKQLLTQLDCESGFLKHYSIDRVEDLNSDLYETAKKQLESKLAK